METGVVISENEVPIYWHAPRGCTEVSIPDTTKLWDVLWLNRARVMGYAHTHPGAGVPFPSQEDLTTFAALEAALGRRLVWWIVSSTHTVSVEWIGDAYAHRILLDEPRWVAELRRGKMTQFRVYVGYFIEVEADEAAAAEAEVREMLPNGAFICEVTAYETQEKQP